jgi:ATP-dependent DNA ligase
MAIEPLRSSPGSNITLFSRRKKSLNRRFPYIVEPLTDLPEGTLVDGEFVAIDESGPVIWYSVDAT